MSGIAVNGVESSVLPQRELLHPQGPSKKPRQETTTAPKPTVTDPNDPWFYTDDISPEAVPLALLPQLIVFVNSSEAGKQLQGATLIRKMLCVAAGIKDGQESNPSDAVMASGVVPRLVDLMRCDERAELQSECSCALSRLCVNDVSAIVELGVVPHFVRLLDSQSDAVREQAARGVGIVAGENTTTRDLVLSHGAMQPLLRCASSNTLSVARNGVWAVSIVCRGTPWRSSKLDSVALPVLVPLLAHSDEEVVRDACWAIFHMSNGNADPQERSDISTGSEVCVERLLNAGALPQIISLLGSDVVSHVTPALRTLGNVTKGTNEHVAQLVSNGTLPFFHGLLKHPRRTIRKEACYTLSNVVADTTDIIQAVIDAELFPLVMGCICSMEDNEVMREALWCVANVSSNGTSEQIRYLVEDLCVFRNLVELLTLFDPKMLVVALESVQYILASGAESMSRDALVENPYTKAFADCGGVDALDQLEGHANDDIVTRARHVNSVYFSEKAESELAGGSIA